MGTPKMLLVYNGKSLLQHVIDEAQALTDNAVVVVTGCYHHLLEAYLIEQAIDYVENNNWASGMGSSVSAGVHYSLHRYPNLESILVLTCDQPFVHKALFQQMIDARTASGKGIAACAYAGTLGIPVLFGKDYLSLLASLKDNQGAKKIIANAMEDVVTVNFTYGELDIDEPEDYRKLLNKG